MGSVIHISKESKHARWLLPLVLVVACVCVLPALGASARLSTHEALVAQGAREMLRTGDWLVPRVGGRPWLEKPPLSHWMVAGVGALLGRIDAFVARFPSACAALWIAACVYLLAARWHGRALGTIAGLCQATSLWLVSRGRLADCDVVLAALVTSALVCFDRIQGGDTRRRWVLAFDVLLGAMSLCKGIGFGAAITMLPVTITLLIRRDWSTARRLLDPIGLLGFVLISSVWPLAILARYPEALPLWWGHVGGRFAGRFAGESVIEFGTWPLVALLPWAPWCVVGAIGSIRRLCLAPSEHDLLLISWFFAPILLVGMAESRNSHYILSALPPAAIWGALGVRIWAERRLRFGWTRQRIIVLAGLAVGVVAMGWAVGYAGLGPLVDRLGKGAEWAFVERVASRESSVPLVFIYDRPDAEPAFDKAPYPTPWGGLPHDLAARLFLSGERPVAWGCLPQVLSALPESDRGWIFIARERDAPELAAHGELRLVERGPDLREDRAFVAYHLAPVQASRDEAASATRSRAVERR